MTNKLKVVSNQEKLTPSEIALQIKTGKWKSESEFVISDYVKNVGLPSENHFVPNTDTILQVRWKVFNEEKVNKAVTKVRSTGDRSGSRQGTMVFFPEDAEYEGIKIKAGSFYIIGGTHGTVIKATLGDIKSKYYIVDFREDLNSDVRKLRRLGNKLNEEFVESIGLDDNDIREEFYAIMDERKREGLDPHPTQEEKDDFTNDYPQISGQTIGNWIAHHPKHGGRRLPLKVYSKPELDNQKVAYENMTQYDGYEILPVLSLVDWNLGALSNLLKLTSTSKKRKVLIPLYAKLYSQMEELEAGKIQKTIKTTYEEIREHIMFDEIKVTFLKWK